MARIRTVKPELWQDESLAKLSRDARLLFVGLFNVADDEGRMRGAPAFIAGQVFPYDEDISVKDLLAELDGGGFIQKYEVDEQRYIFITNFKKHQKIDHPTASKLPEPPEPVSREVRESLASRSIKIAQEGKGREGKGREEDLSTLSTPVSIPEKLALAVQIQSPFDGPSPAEHVEAHYRRVMGKTAGWIFRGTAREQKVNARLKQGYSVEQLCRAIDGCRKSPHHQGQNDTGTVYDDLELICRDAPKVDAFIAIASGKNNSPAAQAASRAATAADRTQQLLANLRNPKPTGEA